MRGSEREGVLESTTGRRIGYLDRGPLTGRPVVYLHGMPGCRHEQRLIPDAVLERFGVRVISVDRPGWGETDPLAGDRIVRSQDVLIACDALAVDKFVLMSVSSGGSYSIALAATAAERVERLVLVSAQMPYDDTDAIASLRGDQLALLPFLGDGRTDLVVAGAHGYRQRLLDDPMSVFADAFATLSPQERAFLEEPQVRELIADDVTAAVRTGIDGIVDDLLLWLQPFELNPKDVACPVVAIHGTADDWEPLPNLRRILDTIARAELVLLDGLNHFGPWCYPDMIVGLAAAPTTI